MICMPKNSVRRPSLYVRVCQALCGEIIDHNPSGFYDDESKKQERINATLRLYLKLFGMPTSSLWSVPRQNDQNYQDASEGPVLYVKTMTGETLKFRFEANMAINQVKMLIQDRQGLPPKQQRLMFAGTLLQNGHTLADYDVLPNSTVLVALDMVGC